MNRYERQNFRQSEYSFRQTLCYGNADYSPTKAIELNRLMGATNPAEADEGTLRKEFAGSIGENAVHGSDSDENAAIEIAYFFSKLELV